MTDHRRIANIPNLSSTRKLLTLGIYGRTIQSVMYFLTVPIADPKLHAAIKTSAAREGMLLKDWVVASLRAALHPSDKKDLERK